ncbi:MAG: anhydro-N-acetylmuramic acid kinase [Acholeplasmataceae bacterium]
MKRLAIGMMSGTSLDGIDVQAAQIEGSFSSLELIPLTFMTFPYEQCLKHRIERVMTDRDLRISDVSRLNSELAYVFARSVRSFCAQTGIDLLNVDFIASHGQTVWHDPDGRIPSTLQLGDGAMLASLLGTTVISNFRAADIAVGGQGAPLVPYFDYAFFRDDRRSRAILNIGGIANLTILPKGARIDEVIAFDTGPGVMVIDALSTHFFSVSFDDRGDIARSGKPIRSLQEELEGHPYLEKKPPKSTGREAFGQQFVRDIILRYPGADPKDLLHTLTRFTADSIVRALRQHESSDELILSGGGAKNDFLVDLLREALPKTAVRMVEDFGFDGFAKEALAFIVLGQQTLEGRPANIKSATGAKKSVILGQIQYVSRNDRKGA